MPAHLRQVRQIEDEDAARVVVREIAVDVGVLRVFNLDARDVEADAVVADDDVFGLADIDAGVRAGDDFGVLHQDVRGLDRVEAVGAIVLVRPARPDDPQIIHRDAVDALRLDAVTLGVLDRKAGEQHAVRRDEQPLARPRLALEAEHARCGPGAAHGDIVDIERQAVRQSEGARAEFDHVARLRLDQRGLQRLLIVVAGGDRYRLRPRGRRRNKQKRQQCLAHHVHPPLFRPLSSA